MGVVWVICGRQLKSPRPHSHHLLVGAEAATDGSTEEVVLVDERRRSLPQVGVDAALDDAVQRLSIAAYHIHTT